MELKVDGRARGLIFDFDGTLADTMPTHLQAWMEAAKNYGFYFSRAILEQHAGMPTQNILRSISREQGLNLDVEEVTKTKQAAYLRLTDQIELIQPVFQILLQSYGKLPIAIGTGECREIALVNIQVAGIADYIDVLVTTDDVVRPKPDPDIFLRCAELMKVAPELCQVFEDGESGLEAARRAGMIVTDIRPFVKNEKILR